MPRVRTKPECSLNKFAEFVYAKPARKETIVKDQKYPKPFPGGSYKEAENVIRLFVDAQMSKSFLASRIQQLEGIYGATPTNSILNSTNGLIAIHGMLPSPLPANSTLESMPRNSREGLMLGNVLIKLRVDALVVQALKSETRIGALKFHLGKTHPLKEDGGKCVAALMYEYLSACDLGSGVVKHTLCYSADTALGTWHQAPSTYKTIIKDAKAACHQYVDIWQRV
jgi:hypothetical protein